MLISQTYRFDFGHPVDQLWAVVADTARWGEAVGFPKYQVAEDLQDDGTVKVTGHTEVLGFKLGWEEPPVDWIVERWFQQRRVDYSRPIPFNSMTTTATLTDLGERSRLEVELALDSRNFFGSWLARRMVAGYGQTVEQLLAEADRLIRAERPELFVSKYQPSESERKRAANYAEAIAQTPYDHGLANRLVEYITSSQEIDLWVMRPVTIARGWGVAAQSVIELFLQAVRTGMLESRWDILCPRCRVSKSKVTNMSDLPEGVHCDSCNIDFSADFTRNVELNFSPNPAVREVEAGFYCRSGPNVTPHIKAQCTVEPGSSRSLPLDLAPGDYRLRTLEAGGEISLSWDGQAFPEIHINGVRVALGDTSSTDEIRIVNHGTVTRSLVIEDQNWLKDALTAERVTTLQAFRDLFSDQVLRPGDEVRIRNIVFMFTDLVGSTSLYGELGDAGAYQMVREHFALLGGIVRDHHGNIVKTIGDGIHAAFLQPEDALRAAIKMQQSIPDFNRRLELEGISIRVGLHSGSSIAVTLNERLDYYGESVNLSARLEGQGQAGDITLSQSFAADPGVSQILNDYDCRRSQALLKGIDEAVDIVQITPLSTA